MTVNVPGGGPLSGLGRPRPNPADLARVRGWARALLDPDDVATIVVNELACREPGCPPVETVIAILSPPPGRRMTIHKPSGQITEADVAAAVAGPDHLDT